MEEYVRDKVGSFPEIRDIQRRFIRIRNQLTFRALSSVRVGASVLPRALAAQYFLGVLC